jgi:hypothetical protein
MLSRLLFVRLKAAENALRDGRLDEAYRLATAPDLREHRRGAAVLAALSERFLERARTHFRADRFAEAMLDLDRAKSGGVLLDEINELRGHVQTVMTEQQRRGQSRHERHETARRRIEGGSLAAGRRILERSSESDLDARRLQRVIEQRAEDAADLVNEAEKLMAQGQLAAAAARLREARGIDAHGEAVARVEARLCDQVLINARSAILEGRLGRAGDELSCLGKLGDTLPSKRELTDMLATAREAARCIRRHLYPDARRHTMTLARLLPEAEWVKAVSEQLRQVDDNVTALFAGPLGGRIEGGGPHAVPPLESSAGGPRPRGEAGPGMLANLEETVALRPGVAAVGALPERLLLLVDGGGSYLVLRAPQASLGRAASSHPPDVPVFSDVAERHANVARVDEDYFLFSGKDVEVGGKKTRHQLLRDGDRIVLGRKAKFTFRLPSRRSPSALLDLSDTTKMPNDVRRVVLFDRHATLGRSPADHIWCQHAGTPLVLFERKGALWLRPKNDGHVDTEPVRLALGEPVEIAGVSLVLEPWQVRSPGNPTV